MQITCKLLANYKPQLSNTLKVSGKYALVSLLSLCSFLAIAQNSTISKNGSYASLNQFDRKYNLAESQQLLKQSLKTDNLTTFQVYTAETDKYGYTHTRFQQYYKGVKVQHGVYFVHSKNGIISHINGDYHKIDNLTEKPNLTQKQALNITLKHIGAAEYAWQNKEAEQELRYLREDSAATYLPKGELVWVKDVEASEKPLEIHRLAYYFDITATKPNLDLAVYTDAHTGQIIQKNSTTCNVIGEAQTRYSGTQQIDVRANAQGRVELFTDVNNTQRVRTLNAKRNPMLDNDNIWTQAEYRPTNDDVALDVHWGGMKVQEYWNNVHLRNGYDNLGTVLNLVARAIPESYQSADNAFWRYSTNTAYFYDGETIFNPLTSLDIVGHEVGHGFSKSWGLDSGNGGETAALHEGFSDIWGACLAAMNGKPNPWLIGGEIMRSNNNSCLRNMINPNDGAAVNRSPDTYGGTFWDDTDSHTRGMILAHWFYLVSVGGNGTNDLGNNFTVNPITVQLAQQIAYQMRVYLTPAATYTQISYAATQAAIDAYGICSPELVSVSNALYAVGLIAQPNTFNTSFVSYPNRPVCNVGENYNFGVEIRNANDDLIYNNMYRWELANGSRTLINGQATTVTVNSSSVTVSLVPTAGFPDGYWETITATPLDCINYRPVSFRFWIGKPDIIAYVITPTNTPEICPWAEVSIPLVDGATRYRWVSLSPSLTISSGGVGRENYAIFRIRGNPRTVRFNIVAANECSVFASKNPAVDPFTYSYQEYEFEVLDGSLCRIANPTTVIESKPTFVGYPNPAENIYTISTQSGEKQNFAYTITNSLGITALTGNSEMGEDAKLDVSSLANGLYVVQIQKGKNTEFLKFVVQKGIIAN